jgi:hypothetical protein
VGQVFEPGWHLVHSTCDPTRRPPGHQHRAEDQRGEEFCAIWKQATSYWDYPE